MTLASQIISDAYRQSNLLSIAGTPTTAQQTEALRYLNRIVKSVYGNEAGEPLESFPLGSNGIDRPSGFPEAPSSDWFVPKNQRLVLNLSAATTVYLHPAPDDGSRFAISDAIGNLATYNLVVDGNGRTIETTATITLTTSGLDREWFYRADQSNWYKLTDLISSDTFPFPEEFDDLFITLLAMRLNPAYGTQMDAQSSMVMNRSRSQFRSRYKANIQVGSEDGLLRMSRSADNFYLKGVDTNSTNLFNQGRTW